MLSELLTSLRTPCPPFVRRMGYLHEAIAMRERHRRRRAAWQPHLDNSRQVVLSAAEGCRDRNKAVVLGSGLLLDVPLAGLSSLFKEVVLTDIVCLPEVRRQIKEFPNATFMEYDVTRIAARIHQNCVTNRHELPAVSSGPFDFGGAVDLIVSLNILSQLWVVPRLFVRKRMPKLGQELVDEWCGRLVDAHYASLCSASSEVCLVADYEFVKRDTAGSIISRSSTIGELKLPAPDSSWTWNIAPPGEESRHYSKELRVGAWLMPRGLSL